MDSNKILNFKSKEWRYPAVAFTIPFLLYLVAMIWIGYYPFGNLSFFISDGVHQYIPFFLDFHRTLREEGLFSLFNWTIGLGVDNIGILAYYLMSPLNFLSVLVPEEFALTYFVMLLPVRIGLASAACTVYLMQTGKKHDPSVILFGCLYSFCAWSFSYSWNCMWLDAFLMLPIVALGAQKLLTTKNPVMYVLALAITVGSNYYASFFVCVFVLLLFAAYQICRWQGLKPFLGDLARFAVYSLLAMGMVAAVLLPAASGLLSTTALNGGEAIAAHSVTAWDILDALKTALTNLAAFHAFDQMTGGPYVSCGVFVLILCIIYLTTKAIPLKERIVAGLIMGFLLICTAVPFLNIALHGFHAPNQMDYRYSFLISFLMVVCGYKAWTNRTKIANWQIYVAAAIVCLLTSLSEDAQHFLYLAGNLLMVLLCVVTLTMLHNQQKAPQGATREEVHIQWLRRRSSRQQAAGAMVVLLGLELVLSFAVYVVLSGLTMIDSYVDPDRESVIEQIQENETEEFYRMEFAAYNSLNDSSVFGYNGITTFSSTVNRNVTAYTGMLGACALESHNRYSLEHPTPLANMFLAQKYVISGNGALNDTDYLTPVFSEGQAIAYRSEAYLPLGFMVDLALADYTIDSSLRVFDQQNSFFTAATGIENTLWHLLEEPAMEVVEQTSSGEGETESPVSYLEFTFQVDRSGLLAIYLDYSLESSAGFYPFTIYRIEGEERIPVFEDRFDRVDQLFSIGNFTEGDVLVFQIQAPEEKEGHTFSAYGAVMDDAVFSAGYDLLGQETMQIASFEGEQICGSVTSEEGGLLYTSVPAETGWTAYVDGNIAEIIEVCGAMVALELTPGTHTIELRYENNALQIGLWISAVSILAYLGLIYFTNHKKVIKWR